MEKNPTQKKKRINEEITEEMMIILCACVCIYARAAWKKGYFIL